MAEYNLHRWLVAGWYDNPYLAPEANPICLIGYKAGDNKRTKTTPIKFANGTTITTESGSVYHLQDIHPDYLKWLDDHKIKYDPDNPIKIK